MSNVEGWNRFAKAFSKQTEYIYSKFDVGRSMFDVHQFFSIKPAASAASGWADKRLLTLFAGLIALVVGLIVGLLFGFLVVIVKIAAGCAGDRADGGSQDRVTRNRPDHGTRSGADGTAAKGPLFGIRHARASTQRQADDQKNYD
jgi:hypothetical protein